MAAFLPISCQKSWGFVKVPAGHTVRRSGRPCVIGITLLRREVLAGTVSCWKNPRRLLTDENHLIYSEFFCASIHTRIFINACFSIHYYRSAAIDCEKKAYQFRTFETCAGQLKVLIIRQIGDCDPSVLVLITNLESMCCIGFFSLLPTFGDDNLTLNANEKFTQASLVVSTLYVGAASGGVV